jgi:hypothetical protein
MFYNDNIILLTTCVWKNNYGSLSGLLFWQQLVRQQDCEIFGDSHFKYMTMEEQHLLLHI